MSEKKNIVIVGGGIMGISTALHLIRRGCDVTIIEKENPTFTTSELSLINQKKLLVIKKIMIPK